MRKKGKGEDASLGKGYGKDFLPDPVSTLASKPLPLTIFSLVI